eukprot:2602686-Rhodomonas_salina.2
MSGTDIVDDGARTLSTPKRRRMSSQMRTFSKSSLARRQTSVSCSQEVNDIVWKCLGYKKDEATGEYSRYIYQRPRFAMPGTDTADDDTSEDVFPKWREKYPNPPDLVGSRPPPSCIRCATHASFPCPQP